MSQSELLGLSREELVRLVLELWRVNQEQQARLLLLEQEVARLKGGPPAGTPREVPAFVKPNRKTQEERKAASERPKPPRKGRPHGYARKREDAAGVTQVVEHRPPQCARCGRRFTLDAGSKHASRQIIELPLAPVEVKEHQFFACRCGACGHRTVARPDLSGEAPRKSRLGVRLMSLIAYLDTVCRMPLRTIQGYLRGVYGLHLSQGAIVRVLHRVARAGQGVYEGLLGEVRRSRVVHADETGAREDGINGQMWSLSTPSVRYYRRDASRGAAVIQELLGYDPKELAARSPAKARQARQERRAQGQQAGAGASTERFHGGLVSDFYAAYDWYPNPQQKCLVHLGRDLHELKEKHPQDPAVEAWVLKVREVLQRARDYASSQRASPTHAQDEQALRARTRRVLEQELDDLARPYANGRSVLPQHVLAERIHRHRRRLLLFVEFPAEVPPDNNAAERAIRPFVVLRKVSGGTRSSQGSKTQDVLMSLFGTWHLRGLDLLQACQQILAPPTPAAPG